MAKLHGISVPHRKSTADIAPRRMGAPGVAYYPMTQHIGAPAKPCVKAGDEVFVGSLIAEAAGFVSAPIYSGVSGKVKKIEPMIQSSGAYIDTVVIEPDGLQTPIPDASAPDVHDFESFIAAIRESGIVGLGGAGFPTVVKLGVQDLSKIDFVIINGAECEPYLTADTRTMLDRADEIADGVALLRKYLRAPAFIFGIEKNKPQCIGKMRSVFASDADVKVCPLPSVYPQGGEKVLIYNTTKRIVEEGKLPIDCGVIVMNCTTLAEISRYIATGIPLVEKCLTVDGSAVKKPQNIIAPIGTPAAEVFEFCGGFKAEPKKILYGGPMMGISLADINSPVLKQTNGLLAFAEEEAKEPRPTPCIKCGRCTNTCPLGLAPVAISAAYDKNDCEALAKLKTNLCMECGCCSFVCPAKRPLVQKNRLAKAELAKWTRAKKAKEEEKK